MSKKGKGSRRDHLTATTPDGKIELTEEELSRVSGGDAVEKTKGKITINTMTRDKVEPFLEE